MPPLPALLHPPDPVAGGVWHMRPDSTAMLSTFREAARLNEECLSDSALSLAALLRDSARMRSLPSQGSEALGMRVNVLRERSGSEHALALNAEEFAITRANSAKYGESNARIERGLVLELPGRSEIAYAGMLRSDRLVEE